MTEKKFNKKMYKESLKFLEHKDKDSYETLAKTMIKILETGEGEILSPNKLKREKLKLEETIKELETALTTYREKIKKHKGKNKLWLSKSKKNNVTITIGEIETILTKYIELLPEIKKTLPEKFDSSKQENVQYSWALRALLAVIINRKTSAQTIKKKFNNNDKWTSIKDQAEGIAKGITYEVLEKSAQIIINLIKEFDKKLGE